MRIIILICLMFFYLTSVFAAETKSFKSAKYIILYVWDGLRADAVTYENTPTLFNLMNEGVQFLDQHSSYPTFTMMNAASFATGDRAGETGFYGNTLWSPDTKGTDSEGKPIDFRQPIFTEDYKILEDLQKNSLFFVDTLFENAHKQNLTTVAIGKSGPAFMQDYLARGIVLDEKHISPIAVAKALQKEGIALPKYTPFAYESGTIALTAHNGNPTAPTKKFVFKDGVTSDPMLGVDSPFIHANEYMLNVYLEYLLPKYKPALSVIWMRNPDSTEHIYGPGTRAYHQALKHNDQMLEALIAKLKKLKIYDETDIIIVSDHAHSHVSGPLNQFPLRDTNQNISEEGYSVSGAIRVADLLTKAGFKAYDGEGCRYNPVMSGIDHRGFTLFQTRVDKTGQRCGKKESSYTTPAYKVPKELPEDAIVVASNGGSDYFYVPSHDKDLITKLVTYLQSQNIFDVIFVDNTRYGDLPGTLPLSIVKIQNKQGRSPDVIVGFSYDTKAEINGLPGIEFADSQNERGMHGSFSPVDVHNFLAACGPDFKKHFKDKLPTGNVDIAPTIAYLLNLPFQSEGRILFEALQAKKTPSYVVKKLAYRSTQSAQDLKIYNLFQEQQKETSYRAMIYGKVLLDGKRSFLYFDAGKAERT